MYLSLDRLYKKQDWLYSLSHLSGLAQTNFLSHDYKLKQSTYTLLLCIVDLIIEVNPEIALKMFVTLENIVIKDSPYVDLESIVLNKQDHELTCIYRGCHYYLNRQSTHPTPYDSLLALWDAFQQSYVAIQIQWMEQWIAKPMPFTPSVFELVCMNTHATSSPHTMSDWIITDATQQEDGAVWATIFQHITEPTSVVCFHHQPIIIDFAAFIDHGLQLTDRIVKQTQKQNGTLWFTGYGRGSTLADVAVMYSTLHLHFSTEATHFESFEDTEEIIQQLALRKSADSIPPYTQQLLTCLENGALFLRPVTIHDPFLQVTSYVTYSAAYFEKKPHKLSFATVYSLEPAISDSIDMEPHSADAICPIEQLYQLFKDALLHEPSRECLQLNTIIGDPQSNPDFLSYLDRWEIISPMTQPKHPVLFWLEQLGALYNALLDTSTFPSDAQNSFASDFINWHQNTMAEDVDIDIIEEAENYYLYAINNPDITINSLIAQIRVYVQARATELASIMGHYLIKPFPFSQKRETSTVTQQKLTVWSRYLSIEKMNLASRIFLYQFFALAGENQPKNWVVNMRFLFNDLFHDPEMTEILCWFSKKILCDQAFLYLAKEATCTMEEAIKKLDDFLSHNPSVTININLFTLIYHHYQNRSRAELHSTQQHCLQLEYNAIQQVTPLYIKLLPHLQLYEKIIHAFEKAPFYDANHMRYSGVQNYQNLLLMLDSQLYGLPWISYVSCIYLARLYMGLVVLLNEKEDRAMLIQLLTMTTLIVNNCKHFHPELQQLSYWQSIFPEKACQLLKKYQDNHLLDVDREIIKTKQNIQRFIMPVLVYILRLRKKEENTIYSAQMNYSAHFFKQGTYAHRHASEKTQQQFDKRYGLVAI